jgi:hypothetical protein
MSSTVTTTTVTTVTAATLFGSLGLILVLALLIFVIKKEIASSYDHPKAAVLSRVLNLAILPLFIAFSMIAVAQLMSIFL